MRAIDPPSFMSDDTVAEQHFVIFGDIDNTPYYRLQIKRSVDPLYSAPVPNPRLK